MGKGIYAGTFDPITNGHIDVIQRALQIFDKLIIAVSKNPKKTLFSVDERIGLIKSSVNNENVEVESFGGLLVEYAKSKNCNLLVRGLRAISDFEHEFQLSSINRKLHPEIETIFIMTSEQYSFLSSSAVREVASLKGNLCSLVPKIVEEELIKKFN